MSYRNATYALVDSLRDVLAIGRHLHVRGSRVAEVRNRVVVIDRPRERCIVTPGRHNNIFASIAETMWVLAGRDDLAFLSHYVERARDYSDDGTTWRAAYGPRLRNWRGVDQVRETLALLRDEPGTRRAAMSLFDPAADFVESKDIPCTNWIHWLLRDGSLHMNVAIRSNDIMWGFSGINTFEWSTLHEMMAFWLGADMGELTHFASSFHLYERHERRARTIVEQFPGITCYEYGIESPRFETAWDDFDDAMRQWFGLEAIVRAAPESLDMATHAPTDPLLRHFLEAIQLYNGHRQGWPLTSVDERLARMPETDVTAAAYEYFHRKQALRPEEISQPAIARWWARYIAGAPANSVADADALRRAISRLHAEKSQAYGGSWKRRGEQISILANIARKVDRLEQTASGAPATRDENFFDTAVDLFVYCIKYETYLADLDVGIANELFDPAQTPPLPPYSDGTEGFDALLARVDLSPLCDDGPTASVAVVETLARFADIEACFVDGAVPCSAADRLAFVERLTAASSVLIAALSRESSTVFDRFVAAYSEGIAGAS